MDRQASVMAITVTLALGCGAPGRSTDTRYASASGELSSVDTSSLTTSERQQWLDVVSEVLSPCPELPMTLAQCIDDRATCPSCTPAARLLVDQVKRGRTRPELEKAFRIRFASESVRDVPIAGSPGRGATQPLVTIVEWADFECPFCGASADRLHALVDRYPNQVRVVFKHYPLSMHKGSDVAAKVAVAADLQGKFWKVHDRLFTLQHEVLEPSTIRQIAEEAGADPDILLRDMKSPAVAEVVGRDRRQGDALELTGTPFILVNGRHFDLQYFDISEDLENWVRLEIELASSSSRARAAVP